MPGPTPARFALVLLVALIAPVYAACGEAMVDLSNATVVTRSGKRPIPEVTAAEVLVEEVAHRTGITWKTATKWPATGPVIAIGSGVKSREWGQHPPLWKDAAPEGFRLQVDPKGGRTIVWILGADPRGALFGVGRFLQKLHWAPGTASIPADLATSTAPKYPLRGHQLGYRATANSYDAWDRDQYEQYIRELAIFGANSIENIPFQDDKPSPVMTSTRQEMNLAMSEICLKYGLDYWVWTPADFDLNDAAKRAEALAKHEAFYHSCPGLAAIMVPGGDPGDNPPELVMPFLEDLAPLLAKYHPAAKIWMSLQNFDESDIDYFYAYIEREMPEWFGGEVHGPSSPPVSESRRRLPKRFGVRNYGDITHNVRCQYPAPWLDPLFGMTLGREAVNPMPMYYARVHHAVAPYTSGFLSYSDGVHDDVNKTTWSACAWDPQTNIRELMVDYARFFFGPEVAEEAGDGILALEKNWEGPAFSNGAITSTLALWQGLEAQAPELSGNWRWQICQLRANYDAYLRFRQFYEAGLEREAMALLASAGSMGADAAMDASMAVFNRTLDAPCGSDLREKITSLCEALFASVGLQTSVERFGASSTQRGAVLDTVDNPLNNRWAIEDEFAAIRTYGSEKEKRARLEVLRAWDFPGEGSFYDDVGNSAKSPHILRGEALNTDPLMERGLNPDVMWMDDGKSHKRLSWQTYMDWPKAAIYDGLDPSAEYTVRSTGAGQALLRIDGERVEPTLYNKGLGEFKEWPVPAKFLEDGALTLTWDRPADEADLNWRLQSRINELWLLKH